ncbi:hypothetical protein K503DRAFT_779753 [Rhizopogon vinicolor AM-OR11-026]|uniref:Uncharacterized protein n=1 Tax=Rhizopogon vinicolor AM-OR11-026 TaxID=1314800 RepID=A0A1B7NCQ3_9AGAM|nr:hypothetical protein K503DRAFT_779753 [Rhizopogon vinicolor AM-OR11-026]
MASMAYYNSPGWVAGFPPHPMQHMGSYPGYPLPPAISQSISPASSGDTHGTPSTTPAPGPFYAYLSGVQGDQASPSAGTPPSPLLAQPPNAWRRNLPPALTPGIPMPPGVLNPNTGPFLGSQGWMPNLGMNQHMSQWCVVHPMFEQRGGPSRHQFRGGNHSHFKSGGRGQPGRPARGSFAPHGAMMNTHSGAGPAHFTGSQQDVQSVS